jgi:hypothetical protein
MADDDRHSHGAVRNRVGISRRDLLRRGAIVGGTVLWTVPVISTITRAHVRPGSPGFTCCECRNPRRQADPPRICTTSASADNPPDCASFCRDAGYRVPQFHYATQPIACQGDGTCAQH